jgi:hypothetical protein
MNIFNVDVDKIEMNDKTVALLSHIKQGFPTVDKRIKQITKKRKELRAKSRVKFVTPEEYELLKARKGLLYADVPSGILRGFASVEENMTWVVELEKIKGTTLKKLMSEAYNNI